MHNENWCLGLDVFVIISLSTKYKRIPGLVIEYFFFLHIWLCHRLASIQINSEFKFHYYFYYYRLAVVFSDDFSMPEIRILVCTRPGFCFAFHHHQTNLIRHQHKPLSFDNHQIQAFTQALYLKQNFSLIFTTWCRCAKIKDWSFKACNCLLAVRYSVHNIQPV